MNNRNQMKTGGEKCSNSIYLFLILILVFPVAFFNVAANVFFNSIICEVHFSF